MATIWGPSDCPPTPLPPLRPHHPVWAGRKWQILFNFLLAVRSKQTATTTCGATPAYWEGRSDQRSLPSAAPASSAVNMLLLLPFSKLCGEGGIHPLGQGHFPPISPGSGPCASQQPLSLLACQGLGG